jgi:hypothetical protein
VGSGKEKSAAGMPRSGMFEGVLAIGNPVSSFKFQVSSFKSLYLIYLET